MSDLDFLRTCHRCGDKIVTGFVPYVNMDLKKPVCIKCLTETFQTAKKMAIEDIIR